MTLRPKPDSVRTLGFTTLASDRPTKAKLQLAASRAGLTLSAYLRLLADQAGPGQGKLIDVPPTRREDNEVRAISLCEALLDTMLVMVDPWHGVPLVNSWNKKAKLDLSLDKAMLIKQIDRLRGLLQGQGDFVDLRKVDES